MDHEIEVNVTYLEVKGCVTLTQYPKASNRLQDKSKSLDHEIYVTMTYRYFEVKGYVILAH